MAFTRKNVAAAVAGTLSLAMLTGCPAPTATGTTPSAAPSAAPSAPTSAAPSTATSAAPSAPASGTPASGAPASAAPSIAVSAPPPSGKTVIVSGTVRNEKGATVDGATVTVKSLNPSITYTANATTTDGSYVVNNVPEGVNVEVIVTKDGYTSRRRVEAFQQSATGQRNLLNFGSQANVADSGAAYFISDYPEIAMTTPEHDAKGVDGTKLSFKVVLSEAVDEDSRDAFEKDFHIFPSNTEAGGAAGGDIEEQEDAGNITSNDITNAGNFPYFIREGNTFLGSSTNKVKASWNAAGTEVTYSFDGNLQTSDDEAAEYQAALFNIAGEKIEDAKGNMLGTNAAGTAFALPAASNLITNAFKDPDLSGDDWADTHKSAIAFELKTDETDPKLTGISVTEDDADLRLQLTFSEPMAAYRGSGNAFIDESVFNLANYSFMVGEKSGDLTNEDLEGGTLTNVALNGVGNPTLGALAAKTEFAFTCAANFATNADLDAAPGGTEVSIEVEPDQPTIVNIWVDGGRDLFDAFRSIKARVAGVKDPAGNNITDTDADKNLATSTI